MAKREKKKLVDWRRHGMKFVTDKHGTYVVLGYFEEPCVVLRCLNTGEKVVFGINSEIAKGFKEWPSQAK